MDFANEIPLAVLLGLVNVVGLFYVSDPISADGDVLLLYFEELLSVDRVTNLKVSIEDENYLRVLV